MFGFEKSETFQTLKMGLDGLERRQLVLSNNISNMATPGFEARDLDFKTVMSAQSQMLADQESLAVVETSDQHLVDDKMTSDIWDQAVVTSTDPPDLQTQMVGINQNSLHYAAVAQALNQQLMRYRRVIQDGSR